MVINCRNILCPVNKKEVLHKLLDEKKSALLKVLLNSPEEMYLKEIATKSNVSITSTFRILQELSKLNIVKKREWKTSKVYIAEKNEQVEFLKELFGDEFDGLQEFIQSLATIPTIQNVILHGTQKKGKANVLLIGENVDTIKVEELCKPIREKGFELGYLTLTKAQYEQMARMGLYSGEKKVLK